MKKNKSHILREEKCSVGNIILRNDKVLLFYPFDHITTININELRRCM